MTEKDTSLACENLCLGVREFSYMLYLGPCVSVFCVLLYLCTKAPILFQCQLFVNVFDSQVSRFKFLAMLRFFFTTAKLFPFV